MNSNPSNPPLRSQLELALSLGVAVVAALVLFFAPGSAKEKLAMAIGYALLVLVFFAGIVVLLRIASGQIDISKLLCEPTGAASMSRFQLLIFTFVVGLSFFYVVASSGALPSIPTEVLTLFGISASTYAVSKGIQFSSPEGRQAAQGNGKQGGQPKDERKME